MRDATPRIRLRRMAEQRFLRFDAPFAIVVGLFLTLYAERSPGQRVQTFRADLAVATGGTIRKCRRQCGLAPGARCATPSTRVRDCESAARVRFF